MSIFLSIITNSISLTNIFSFNNGSYDSNIANKVLNTLDLAIKKVFVCLIFYRYVGSNKKMSWNSIISYKKNKCEVYCN